MFPASLMTRAVVLCITIGFVDIGLAEDSIDPAAEKTIRQMAKFYRGINSFSVDVNSKFQMGSAANHDVRHVVIERPNHLSVQHRDDAEATVVCDGKQLLAHLPSSRHYLLEDATDSFDGILQGEAIMLMGLGRVAVQLAAADPYSQFMESVTALSLLEYESIDDVACQRVVLTQEGVKSILWIETGNRPLLRKIEWTIDANLSTGDDQADVATKLPQIELTLNNWSIDPQITADTFTVHVPENATQVESILFANKPESGPHHLLGMDAPDAKLQLLDGGSQALVDQEGNKVVVLDFWAIWCAPCVEALPSLAKVAGRFADRDVAVFAVNVGDEAADIKEFLKQIELDVPVAMDTEGAISDRFGAETIPQTVIIDKQGKVQVVHVGLMSRYEETLAEEIESVLAGRQLAAETLSSARAAQRPGEKIPAGPDAMTSRDLASATHAFDRRTTIDAYKEHGSRNPAWDDQAITFFEEIARHFSQAEGFKNSTELITMAEQLSADGCTDPLVDYCHGALLVDTNLNRKTYNKGTRLIQASYAALVERGYPANRCFTAALREWRRLKGLEDQAEKVAEYLDLTLKHAAEMTLQDDITNNEGRKIAEILLGLMSELSLQDNKRLYEAVKVHEDEESWLVNLLCGRYHVAAAFADRGTGLAKDVTQQGWQGMAEHLQEARRYLERAWEVAPARPEVPVQMMSVALGSGTLHEMRLWFDRAAQGQLDYLPAYHRLLHGLLPRWHGEHELMYQFGLECAETERYDTDVPYMLVVALWNIASDSDNSLGDQYWKRPGIYENVKSVCEGYISRASEPNGLVGWWKTVLLCFAYRTEHWDDANVILDEVAEQLDADALSRFTLEHEDVVVSARMHTGPHSQAILEALSWEKDGRRRESIELLTAVIEKEGIHPLVRRYLRSRSQSMRWLVAFKKGKEVDLTPDSGLIGWYASAGTWNLETDGSLRGVSSSQGVVLRCLGDFGSSWELSGELEHGKSRYSPWDAGVLFYSDNKPTYGVMMNPSSGWAAAGPLVRRVNGSKGVSKADQTPYKHEGDVVPFVVRLDDGKVDVWFDGTQVSAEKEVVGWTKYKPFEIGVGAMYSWDGSVLTFRKLKIKPIKPAD